MKTHCQPLVSILTPVYNGEAHLRECIESVLRQTYENWEYLIINNRSADATLAIAEQYARRDRRIRIHNNREFVGAIANHNLALQHISPRSSFCKMVHADDLLFPECVEKMVELAEANPGVGMVSSYALWGDRLRKDGVPYPETVVRGRDICRARFLNGLDVFGSPTTTLIRSDIIRRIQPFYNERNIHADTEAGFAVLAQADFGFVHQVLTFTRLHRRSATSSNQWMDTLLPGHLEILLKYGPVFLTQEEFTRIKRDYLREYYSCLARRALRPRGKQYWQFHMQRLRQLGISINPCRIAAAGLIEVVKLCLAPARWRRMLQPARGPRVEPREDSPGE